MSREDVSGEDVVRLLIYYTHSRWIYTHTCIPATLKRQTGRRLFHDFTIKQTFRGIKFAICVLIARICVLI